MDHAATFSMLINDVDDVQLHCEDLAARLLVEKFEGLLVENEGMRRTIETQLSRIAALEKANASLLRSFSTMCDDRAQLVEVRNFAHFHLIILMSFAISGAAPFVSSPRCQRKHTKSAPSYAPAISCLRLYNPWPAQSCSKAGCF